MPLHATTTPHASSARRSATMSARVSGLTIYPVKSCSGVHVDAAVLTETGLRFDRAWMVVEDRPKKARVRASRASPRETPRVHVPLAARRAPPRACHRHPPPRGSRPVVGRPPPPLGRRARHLRPDHAPKPHHPPRRPPRFRASASACGSGPATAVTRATTPPRGSPNISADPRVSRDGSAPADFPGRRRPRPGNRGAAPGSRRAATAAAPAGFMTHRAVDARFRFASRGRRSRLLAETLVKTIGGAAATIAHDAAVAFVARRLTPRRRCEAALSARRRRVRELFGRVPVVIRG